MQAERERPGAPRSVHGTPRSAQGTPGAPRNAGSAPSAQERPRSAPERPGAPKSAYGSPRSAYAAPRSTQEAELRWTALLINASAIAAENAGVVVADAPTSESPSYEAALFPGRSARMSIMPWIVAKGVLLFLKPPARSRKRTVKFWIQFGSRTS